MKNRIQIVVTFIIALLCFQSKAQELSIQVLQQGTTYDDSSYYDIIKVGENFWVGGKYGTLKLMDKEGNLSNIEYPNQNLDIYKFDKFDENNIIACGDKGVVYKHNLQSKTWETIRVKGYEKACFYNMVVADKNTAYICGGNSAIAHSEKTVPLGFVLKSTDAGKTWQRIYLNPFKMVWCVKYNEFDGKVYALTYTPNRTNLIALEGEKWAKKAKIGNSIFHEIQFLNKDEYVATGGWMGKMGRIYRNKQKVVIPNAGLIWGRVSNQKYDLYSGCDGKIVLDDKKGNYRVFGTKLNKAFNIYEAVFTSENTAIAIGSARTILKIQITDNQTVSNGN